MVRLFVFAFCSLALISCSDNPAPKHDYDRVSRPEGARTAYSSTQQTRNVTQRRPWESWQRGADLQGVEFKNEVMKRADELVAAGDRRGAIELYGRVNGERLSAGEGEALVLRLAACELSLGNSDRALSIISDLFDSRGLGPDQVDKSFGLVLAFAYARKGDTEQALAWFSRVKKQASPGSAVNYLAKNGVSTYLQTVPENELAVLAGIWDADGFIRGLIGEERRLRAQRGWKPDALEAAYWRERSPSQVQVAHEGDGEAHAAPASVAILLPLSGKFAGLGQSTMNGMNLVFGTAAEQDGVKFIRQDTAGDGVKALEQFDAVLADGVPTVVLGPLLADEANAVVPVASRRAVPLLTFAKRGDLAQGSSIFRLGPTLESQVASLLEVTHGQLGLSRYAIVYPDTQSGREFAEQFGSGLIERGLDVAYQVGYGSDSPEIIQSLTAELEKQEIDAVFLPDAVERAARVWGSMSSTFRSRVRLLGPASWDGSRELTTSRNLLQGALFVTPFFAGSSDLLVSQFRDSYLAQYGKQPDFLAAQAFDAATLVMAAVRREREEGVKFVDAMRSIDGYEGLTGRIKVSDKGELERQFKVVELKDGVLAQVATTVGSEPHAQLFNR